MLNLSFVRLLHERAVVPAFKSLIADKAARGRLLGGAAITGITFASVQVGLTIAFLWSHDIFDAEFAANHTFALLASVTFISALAYFGAWLMALRAHVFIIEKTLESLDRVAENADAEAWELKLARGKSQLDRIFLRIFRCLIVVAVVTTLWPIFKAMMYGEPASITVGIAILLVASVLVIRWYIHDAVVSNYLTALAGTVSIGLVLAFPYHSAVMYQQLALRPFGMSGIKVHISTEDNELDACLILLGQSTVWLRQDDTILSIPRDRAIVKFDLRQQRSDRNCTTVKAIDV